MDSAARWTQGFEVGKSMDELSAPNSCTIPPAAMEKKVRPAKDQAVNCPRCHSTNTKFCYYNNYSLTQPRYFCKTCRRYWTEGGTLRSVPVGGGSRKNKKSSSTTNSTSVSSSVSSSHKLIPDLNPNSHFPSQNPKILGQVQDLNLGFGGPQNYQHGMIPQFLELPKMESRDVINSSNSNPTSSASLSTLNFLRNGFNSFVPMAPSAMETNALFAPGFQFQECKPALGFSVDGMSNGSLLRTNTNLNDEPQENSNGSFVFPFAAMKRQSNASEADQIKGSQQNSNGYWNGMLGGGSW